MMDVQLPHIASASTSGATGTQSAPRLGQGGGKRESAGFGKSFKSELREVHTAKEPRHEVGRSQAESDEHDAATSSDESAPTTTAPTASGAAKDEQAGDRAADPSRQNSETVTASPLPDVTTQSVLLALIAQPIVTTEAQALMQTSSGEQTHTAVESVMLSVMEDGTSLPVTAADSSIYPQAGHNDNSAGPSDSTAPIQSGAVPLSHIDAGGQKLASADEETVLSSEAWRTPAELRNLQREKPAVPLARDEQTQPPSNSEMKTEPMVLPDDQRAQIREDHNVATALAAEHRQQAEDNRPVVAERPTPVREAPDLREEGAPRELSAASPAWQEPANQNEERGMEWSGRDHRERLSADRVLAKSTVPDVAAPAPPPVSTLMTNGMDRGAFSSAPSAQPRADTPPAVPAPPVQPTDWMPGTSANQTKSMVLELSQADLGWVNIRVAVNQDTVHTHFSSERNEMGQYLVNGQDRLQSALNASGLDLGRFQVDIDRQSAGRSFQQPASQGQSQGQSPQGESQTSGQGHNDGARDTTPRHGMLNLVA